MRRSLVRLVIMTAALIVLLTPQNSEAQEFCWIEAWCHGFCWGGSIFDPQNVIVYRCCDLNALYTTCNYEEVEQGCCWW